MEITRGHRPRTRFEGIELTILSAALAFALSAPAAAVEIRYDVGATARASDNIGLAETNGSRDVLVTPRLSFEAKEAGGAVELNARGNLEYLYFAEKTFNNQVRGELIGSLDWTIVPGRTNFVVEEYLTRELVNAFESRSAGNEQLVNILVAGPTFTFRFNEATRGQLDLRYAVGTAQETKDFNSGRAGIAGRVVRDIDAQQRLSFNAEATRVAYATAQPAFDYTRRDGYLGYERNLADIDINADIGYSSLSATSGGQSVSGPLVRIYGRWQVAPRSLITIQTDYQISDSTQNLITRGTRLEGSAIGDLIDANPDAILSPELFRTRRADARYVFTDERLIIALRTYYERLRYVQATRLDETSNGAVIDMDYKFRPRWTANFQIGREARTFTSTGRDDFDFFVNASLVNEITRHWALTLAVIRRQRDSTEVGRDYQENAIAMSFSYRR